MARKVSFKDYKKGQQVLFPESMDDYIDENAPVRLIDKIVDKLDLTRVLATYKGGGTSSYHPRMMLKVLFFAYMNNIYSSRKIAKVMRENIHFMWLSGKQFPKHNTINNFRSSHLKDTINELFTQVVLMLVEMGQITLEQTYIDGTKIESRANKYTFVWRKSVEKHKAKLEIKIAGILSQIEEGIASDNSDINDEPVPINSDELLKRIEQINTENKTKQQQKQIKELKTKHIPKLREYETHLSKCGNRNSYSKTDKDATFMRMKEDAMKNGQLKPGYNLQIGTENQYITNFDIFHNPNDAPTLKPFLNSYQDRYKKMPKKVCGDAGYGSEENYEFMEKNLITAFVKYYSFHKEQKKSYKENPFLVQNLYYNAQEDYFVCPMGQHMTFIKTSTKETENGYKSTYYHYQAQNCRACPLRSQCHKAKGNRVIQINKKLNAYKTKTRDLLISEEGLYHRSRRPVEPEAVFGQIKENKQYRRFRHFGKDKVLMDFAILAIAFNIEKLHKALLKALNSFIFEFFKQIFTSKTQFRHSIIHFYNPYKKSSKIKYKFAA